MNILLLGATGLTGSACLSDLLTLPVIEQVTVLCRTPLSIDHPKLVGQTVDFERLSMAADRFDVDVVICCLGTTIRKAGSKAAFRKVDLDYCVAAAELAKACGVKVFMVMSAIGASPTSPVFYNRVKGELEASLTALQFPRLSIYRPGLLLGSRNERRIGETAMGVVMPALNHLLLGSLRKYRGLESAVVARAMAEEVRLLDLDSLQGQEVVVRTYDDIMALAYAASL